MIDYNIGLLLGDGVGSVICKASGEILDKLGHKYNFGIKCSELQFGKSAYQLCDNPLPAETVDGMKKADASLVFGVDSSGIPGSTPVGRLRKALGLFAEVRTVKTVPGRWALKDNINLSFVRELTEGFLSDRNLPEGKGEWMEDSDTAYSLRVIRRSASQKIAQYAFDFAKKLGYKKVTSVHKASIFKLTCGLFLEECRKVASKYPEIEYGEMTADDVAGDLVSCPEKFGVILTTNMFGDILSDEGAALVSGLCVGVNIGPEAKLYMPVRHSAAYEKLEADNFDSLPAMCCVVQMLNELEQHDAAADLEKAMFSATGTGSSYLNNLIALL